MTTQTSEATQTCQAPRIAVAAATPSTRIKGPHLGARDLLDECIASLLARPGRSALTVLGTVVGMAALVATLGLSKTAGNQIVSRFDALAATDITVGPKVGGNGRTLSPFSRDAEARMARLAGVVAAGTLSDVDVKGALITAVPVRDPQGQSRFSLPVKAASPGLFRAIHTTLSAGRLPDEGHSERGDRVAVLGAGAAARLGIDRVDAQPGIFIGDRLYAVIGIIGDVSRQAAMLSAVIVPEGTARHDYGLLAPASVQIETAVGAADLIASQAALALSPADPTLVKVTAPPEPRRAKANVQGDLDALFLLLGAVSLLVGAIGIANVTLVSVMERIGEIGLRRALGAARHHIAIQFLAESTALGAVGGIVGASVGTLATVGVAAARSWTPVLEPWVPLWAPGLGAGIGLLSGLYPALRAAAMEPVESLRSAT